MKIWHNICLIISNMYSKWAIIADDFTGAGDSAVHFVSQGDPVLLLVNKNAFKEIGDKPETIVLNTDTRFLDRDTAYRKVFEATCNLYSWGYRNIFKKIDSTLRGNPADEIAAVMDAGGFKFVIVAPSAPKNRRTVVDGICMINGVPLHKTTIANDPFTPITSDKISDIFQIRFSQSIKELPLSCIRSKKDNLFEIVKNEVTRGTRVFISDAESIEDLKKLSSLSSLEGILFAGSSGLAEALAGSVNHFSSIHTPVIPLNQILFTIGSLSEQSQIQCKNLLDNEEINEIIVEASNIVIDPQKERDRILRKLDYLRQKCPILLRTDAIINKTDSGSIDKNIGAIVSQFLGDLSREIIQRCNIKLLFASGGDTASQIIKYLDTDVIRFVSEIIPGIPFGYFNSPAVGRRIYFISKSGGFGEEDAMLQCLRLVSSGAVNE